MRRSDAPIAACDGAQSEVLDRLRTAGESTPKTEADWKVRAEAAEIREAELMSVCRLAYRHALGGACMHPLSDDEERLLGRRLAQLWMEQVIGSTSPGRPSAPAAN